MSEQKQPPMPEGLRTILVGKDWLTHEDSDLFVLPLPDVDGEIAVRVAYEDDEWWVTLEYDGSTILRPARLRELTELVTKIEQAIGSDPSAMQ